VEYLVKLTALGLFAYAVLVIVVYELGGSSRPPHE
jgi:hypothetical protein